MFKNDMLINSTVLVYIHLRNEVGLIYFLILQLNKARRFTLTVFTPVSAASLHMGSEIF